MFSKTVQIGLLFCLFFSFLSCGEDDREECVGYENAPITEVTGPSTASVGEAVSFEVEYALRNSCGSFERIVENTSDFIRMIAVEARYEGCACFQAIVVESVTYSFTPEATGEYELHFRNAAGDYIIRELVVE